MNDTKMPSFAAGDTVYGEYGNELVYVCAVSEGHIARPIIESIYDDGSESYLAEPNIYGIVFANPPAPKYDAETKRAKDELAEARADLTKAKNELRQVTTDRDHAMATIGKYPDLACVSDWIAGKMTHIGIIENYGGITITTIEEALKSRSDVDGGKVRLLALYGGLSGVNGPKKSYGDDLRWQLNTYSDGSDRYANNICFMGSSVESVRERIQVWLNTQLRRSDDSYMTVNTAESAVKLGFVVPLVWAEKVKQKRSADRKRKMETAEANVKELRQRAMDAEFALAKLYTEATEEGEAT